MTVGERIKQAREAKGMSQQELAEKMGYKDRSSISKIEKNKDDDIMLDAVQKIADVLGCSPLYLMGWETEESQNDTQKTSDRIKTYAEFINLYEQLNDSNRELVDNMLKALSSKQSTPPASED